MAEATKFENIQKLTNTDTISGPAVVELMLTAVTDAAKLTLTIGSNTIEMSAPANTSVTTPGCIRLGNGISATVTLTGTGATAYAIHELD
jgi:hypothetical protein